MKIIYETIVNQIPSDKVLTITEIKGSYSEEFTRGLKSYLNDNTNIQLVDYDIHKMALEESLRYAEPVFDNRFNETMPRLTTPEISIIGSANLQKSNFIFKQKEHFDYEIILVDLSTGLILANINDRVQMKYNPPILLLFILITLIIAVSRWIIHLRKGYNVLLILSFALGLITLIVVWFLL